MNEGIQAFLSMMLAQDSGSLHKGIWLRRFYLLPAFLENILAALMSEIPWGVPKESS